MSDDAKMVTTMAVALALLAILLTSVRMFATSSWSKQTCYPLQPIEYVEHGTWIGAVCAAEGGPVLRKKP